MYIKDNNNKKTLIIREKKNKKSETIIRKGICPQILNRNNVLFSSAKNFEHFDSIHFETSAAY